MKRCASGYYATVQISSYKYSSSSPPLILCAFLTTELVENNHKLSSIWEQITQFQTECEISFRSLWRTVSFVSRTIEWGKATKKKKINNFDLPYSFPPESVRKLISAKIHIFSQFNCQMFSLVFRNIDRIKIHNSVTNTNYLSLTPPLYTKS